MATRMRVQQPQPSSRVAWQDLLRAPSEYGSLSSSTSPLRHSTALNPASKSESELNPFRTRKIVLLAIFTQIQRAEHLANALPIGGADAVRFCIMSYLKNAIPDAGSAITRPENEELTEWRGELGDAVRTTVANAKLRSSFRKHKSHSIGSLLQDIDRILSSDYTPTERDLLLSLQPTSGYSQTAIRKPNAMITLVDAGGRLQQRRKWSQCLVDASVVVLCVSLTDYDRYMRWTSADNQPMTAIHDSLLIAEELATRMMRHVPLFVVFTKYDLLQPKLAAGSSIKSAFTDYTGPEDSQQHIIDYLRALFVKATRGGDVRFHTCNGLDMNEVVRLWNELVGVVSK